MSPVPEVTQAEATYPSKDGSDHTIEWTPAYFNPPLAAERNGWVLNQLRRYSIRTILDIGCGEGDLLRCLCEPSRERYDPCTPLDHDISSRSLYPILLAGLDPDLWAIRVAAERTIPREFDSVAPRYAPNGTPRWDELKLKLWHGGIEDVNEDFVTRYQCFVSMEVVEHLREDILELFLPLVLGYYRPEYLLLTTPNYLFNELFSAPTTETLSTDPNESSFVGFPDPTGKTSRIFRHIDHKREWTPEEWREWCEEGARKHGYSAELSSIGWLGRPDPFGREVKGGHGGSLTAVFRRTGERERVLPAKFTSEINRPPVPALVSAPYSSPTTLPLAARKHRLVAEHLHTTHPHAGSSLPAAEILSLVRGVFSQSPENELAFEMLWLSDQIDVACGGNSRVLLDAFLTDGSESTGKHEELEWEIMQGSSSDLLSWFVLWRKWTQPPSVEQNVWAMEEDAAPWDEAVEDDEYEWPTTALCDGPGNEPGDPYVGAQTGEFRSESAATAALDEWHSQINADARHWAPTDGNGWGETTDNSNPAMKTALNEVTAGGVE